MANKDEQTGKLWELIRHVGVAMLTSEDGGQLRSRPMWVSQRGFDGALWFFTRAGSHKVEEVRRDNRVGVSFAHPGRQDYVSLSGRASLVRDPAAVKEHWSEAMRAWFPKGTDDSDIALLRVDVETAEYWDAPSSTMVHLAGYAKAVLTGEPPHPGDNEKLRLS